MRLALVAPRYGEEMPGPAARHAQWVAQRLATRHTVEVLSTSSTPGLLTEGGLSVRRFGVTQGHGAPDEELEAKVRAEAHSDAEELRWIEARGPLSPPLLDHVRAQTAEYDALLFFSYSAWTTYHGLRIAPHKSLLVPTAEDEEAPPLRAFQQLLRRPAALAFNAPEERAELARRAEGDLRGEVVGFGIDDTPAVAPEEIRQRLDLLGDFIVYAGRPAREQGCSRLFEDFTRYVRERSPHLSLVLMGKSASPIPVHVNITHLGLLSDVERRSAIAASRLLVQPSSEGGLALPVLEAWAMGRPALVNGRCPALCGQVLRANGGLAYTSYDELAEALTWLLERPRQADALGRAGRAYAQAHYAPSVILEKYERLLATVRGH